jgi:MFS family permease
MTSLCTEFWQIVLAQGFGVGLGTGIIFLPAISVISHYFIRRRALAIGVVVTGSSIGGVCLPIMLNNLTISHGFKRAVQYTGYLLLGCFLAACLLMRPRFPPKRGDIVKPTIRQLFSSLPYSFTVAGLFFVAWGLFFPVYYLQVS